MDPTTPPSSPYEQLLAACDEARARLSADDTNPYDKHPSHPLAGMAPAVLRCARLALLDGAESGDVHLHMVEPLADAMLIALSEGGHLR